MKFSETLSRFLAETGCWADNNAEEIREGFDSAHRSVVLHEAAEYEEISQSFWPSYRTYSEMPMCDFVWHRVEPPPGFKTVPWKEGRVNIIDELTKVTIDSCNHVYAQGFDDLIICLTPGLFEALGDNLLPGERLARLKRKVPDLITLHPDGKGRDGIGVLLGKRQEIVARLNLEYTIQL